MLQPPAQYGYYKALEIAPSASSQEIKKAYKKLALKYHPDKHKQRKQQLDNNASIASVNNQFILINEAYSVLAHEESRARYDSFCAGETSDQELSCECGEIQLMHKLFREIMAKKEKISELSESFESFAISMGWMMQTYEDEDRLFCAIEKEITLIESSILNILEENADVSEQASSDISTRYLSEEDTILVMNNPQWLLIEKVTPETLIHHHQLSGFVKSHMSLIRSVKIIVSPLMMACADGTWGEQKIDLLQRVTSLMTQIIQYLEFIIQKAKMDGEGFESIIDKMETQDIQTQIINLSKHPILSKVETGQFGQNKHPLISLAALLGPPLAGQSLYWSILAVILLGMVCWHHNEGDLESFQQFLNIFEEIVPLLDNIAR